MRLSSPKKHSSKRSLKRRRRLNRDRTLYQFERRAAPQRKRSKQRQEKV